MTPAVPNQGPPVTRFQKLRPGPGRAPGEVLANQRARLRRAMVRLVAEHGYGGVTVRELSRVAGVSTRAFYECFRGVEDCFAATYAGTTKDALRQALDVSVGSESQLRIRLHAFLSALVDDQDAARLVLVDAPSLGSALASKLRDGDRALERFVAAELAAGGSPTAIEPAVARGVVAATMHLARSQLLSDQSAPSMAMIDEFADWLLAVGAGGATDIRSAATIPPDRSRSPDSVSDLGDQRRFLMAAVVRLSLRDGYQNLTIPAIRREAGVSRRVFDEHFVGVADCFLAAVEATISTAMERAESQAILHADGWEAVIVRGIRVLCAELARDPALAQLGLLDILAPGTPGLELRDRLFRRWARHLRQIIPKDLRPGRLAAEASVAAAVAMAANDPGHSDWFRRTMPRVAFVILAPVVGPGAAVRAIEAEFRSEMGQTEVRKHLTYFS